MSFDQVRAKQLSGVFDVEYGDALHHLSGVRTLRVPCDEVTALTFSSDVEGEAAHAILSKRRIFALRTQDSLGCRLWVRWSEAPDPALVKDRLTGWLRGLQFRIACEGTTAAPLWNGGRTWGPDGKAGNWARFPQTLLAPLARRLAQKQGVQ